MNIYDVHINHIYINQPNFINVTMYCFIQIIHLFCYYMYSSMYIMYPNGTGVLFSTCWHIHRRQALVWLQKRWSGTRVAYIMWHKPSCTLGYPERDNTLYTFCQCMLYTVHSITTVLLNCAVLHEQNWCSYISYIYNSVIY